MTRTEARIRSRLFGTSNVQVFDERSDARFEDDDVVRVYEGERCLHVWSLWDGEVWEWCFPWSRVTEYRVSPSSF